MVPDDIRIPDSLKIAAQKGIEITFGTAQLREAHPNSAQIYLTGETGRTLEVIAESTSHRLTEYRPISQANIRR